MGRTHLTVIHWGVLDLIRDARKAIPCALLGIATWDGPAPLAGTGDNMPSAQPTYTICRAYLEDSVNYVQDNHVVISGGLEMV